MVVITVAKWIRFIYKVLLCSDFVLTPLSPTARAPQPWCPVPRNRPCGLPPWQPRGEPCAGPAATGLWTAPYLYHRYLHDYGHAKCHHLEWHSPQNLNMGWASLVGGDFLSMGGLPFRINLIKLPEMCELRRGLGKDNWPLRHIVIVSTSGVCFLAPCIDHLLTSIGS